MPPICKFVQRSLSKSQKKTTVSKLESAKKTCYGNWIRFLGKNWARIGGKKNYGWQTIVNIGM